MIPRCLVLLILLGAPVAVVFPAEPSGYQRLGEAVSAAQLQDRDTDLAPTGAVPVGSGTVAAGRELFEARCQHCHGAQGRGGLFNALALQPADRAADGERGTFAMDPARQRVVANYWPYATTLYDYIRRAMPQLQPGTLSNDEAYALTAYVLFLNALVDEAAIVDGVALQQLSMPARSLFQFSEEARRLQH